MQNGNQAMTNHNAALDVLELARKAEKKWLLDGDSQHTSFVHGYLAAASAEQAQADKAGMVDKLPTLPEIDDEGRQFLHYNPNTDDLVEFVQNYAKNYASLALSQPSPTAQGKEG